jgi:hypothetical protein
MSKSRDQRTTRLALEVTSLRLRTPLGATERVRNRVSEQGATPLTAVRA